MKNLDEHIINSWAKQLADKGTDWELEKDKSELSVELNNEYKVFKNTWKTLKEMQEIEQFDTDKAWNKLYSKIEEDEPGVTQQKIKPLRLNRKLAIAASITILMGLAGLYLSSQYGFVRVSNKSLAAHIEVLPDGSEVLLNAKSQITYRKYFGKNTREISLNGEAFFKVEKDETKPFIIQTQNSFVKVLGTSFNVNAKKEWVEVLVETGRVEVYNNSMHSEHVVLLPGDFAQLDGKNKIEKTLNSNENYLSWVNQKLVFQAMPLEQVVSHIMKTYYCTIELASHGSQLAADYAVLREQFAQATSALGTMAVSHRRILDATREAPSVGTKSWGRQFVVTRYIPRSPDYGRFNDGYTSTLKKADPDARIVAVDPALVPYGSRVWIEGLGWFNAEDCGSAIKGFRLDILTATTKESMNFGRQKRFVIVVPPGAPEVASTQAEAVLPSRPGNARISEAKQSGAEGKVG
jgi:ferric-dicitrate binding protein FerR (iron transport regulator)/3D (Asp-Asp-Asp) domain-containing protein